MSRALVAKMSVGRQVRLNPGGDCLLIRPNEEGLDAKAFSEDVVVQRDGDDIRTEGGIYVPENVKERAIRRHMIGEVLAVGPAADILFKVDGLERVVQIGDEVLYPYFPGHIIDRSPDLEAFEDCIIMSERDVLAIVEEVS